MKRRLRREQTIRQQELSAVLHSMAMLLRAGVSLVRSVEILATQEPNARLKKTLEGLSHTVSKDGEPFSTACARYPRVFPESVVVLMKIGESVGDLPGRLEDGHRLIERQQRMQDDIRKVLIGPVMTLVSCLAMLYVIVGFVIPRMTQLYVDMRVDLPIISKIVLGVVQFVCSPLMGVILVAAGFAVAIGWEAVVPELLAVGLRLRYTRKIIGQCLATSFCSMVGQLYQDGVALSVAVDVLAQSTHFPVYSDVLHKVNQQFKHSGDLAGALAEIPFFPATVAAMMKIGQETGQADRMLLTLARILDEDTQDLFNRLLTLLEPVLMIVFGVVLCVLFIGLFLPIYGVLSHLEI